MPIVIQAAEQTRQEETEASIHQSALSLKASHGPGARDEAGRRFEICMLLGSSRLARHWRAVDLVLGEIREIPRTAPGAASIDRDARSETWHVVSQALTQ